MNQRNPEKAEKQFTKSFEKSHRHKVWDQMFDKAQAWYESFNDKGDEADTARQNRSDMLFATLEMAVGDYCDALQDERWQAMTFDSQTYLIRNETIHFLSFNFVCDINDRGGVT